VATRTRVIRVAEQPFRVADLYAAAGANSRLPVATTWSSPWSGVIQPLRTSTKQIGFTELIGFPILSRTVLGPAQMLMGLEQAGDARSEADLGRPSNPAASSTLINPFCAGRRRCAELPFPKSNVRNYSAVTTAVAAGSPTYVDTARN
jgi:hypothetical protein